MKAEARNAQPGALAMHQTFVRPLEAEDVGFPPQLPSPPRLEWLELGKYWKAGQTAPVWFLADPARSDLALIDPRSRDDATEVRWPLVARPAFGGMRPSAVRWYRMPAPGWFVEEGWSLTPEAAGMSRLMTRASASRRRSPRWSATAQRRGAHADRRPQPRRLQAIRRRDSRSSIDGIAFQQLDAAPGFFLHAFDIPAGRLMGEGAFATLTIQSTPASGAVAIPTAIEQFDLQDADDVMWAYGNGLAGGGVLAGAWCVALDDRACHAAHRRPAASRCG